MSVGIGDTILVAEASFSTAEKTPIDVKWVQDKKDRDAKWASRSLCMPRAISKTADSSLTSLASLPGRERRQRRKFPKDIVSLLGRFKTLGKDVTSWERRQRYERKILRASENNIKGHGGRLLRQLHGNGSYTGYVADDNKKLTVVEQTKYTVVVDTDFQ
ncbi:hypothetical protein B0H13DRAFT_1867494 [Mycena leptocephala]|nr:hypothetical protein B0H13DRAFT_1867494 [Mycena leptocephala]